MLTVASSTLAAQPKGKGILYLNTDIVHADKQKHFLYGGMAAAPVYLTFRYRLNQSRKMSVLYTWAFATLIGTGKEFLDSKQKGDHFDIGDLAITSAGGLFVSLSFDLIIGKDKK